MKIGDNSNSKSLAATKEVKKEAETSSQAAAQTPRDSEAVKTSLGRVLSEVEAVERRQKILELKARYDNDQLNYSSEAIADKVAQGIDEETSLEQQLAENF